MSRISRRAFIKGAAAGTAGLWIATSSGVRWASAAHWSPYQPDPEEFSSGVASGDPTPNAVVLWTRVTPPNEQANVPVAWEVSEDPGFGSPVAAGKIHTSRDRDFTVKVDVGGLAPGRTYYYRFSARDTYSRVGRTRTVPADPSGLAFALVSCQNLQAGYYAAWRHIAARDLDFVLHVGDYIYEGGANDDALEGHVHDPPHEILTLDDYRRRYRNYRSDADLRAAHAAHPFVVTMDDHEVANNSWSGGAGNHQDGEGDYLERRARAFQVYDEYMPVRLPAGRDGADMRIYRSLSFGALADLFVLDTRQYRDQQTSSPLQGPAPQTNPDNGAAGRTYLGDDQKEWLKVQLSESGATWKLLGNQAMLAQFTYGTWPDEVSTALQGLIGMPPDGYTVNPDQWDGYQAEQKELLKFLRDGTDESVSPENRDPIENTLVLTGDIHMSFANEVYVDEGKFRIEPPVAAEFIGPSISSTNFNEATMAPPRTSSLAIEQIIKAGNPHIRYVEVDSNGYVVVRLTPESATGEWYHLSDVRDRDATEELATAWKADAGDLTLDWVGGEPVAT